MTKMSEVAIDVIRSLFRFGTIASSKSDSASSIVAKVSADEGESGPTDNEMWGHAPLSYKPVNDTECLFYQLGDERVVFATKDRQHEISIGNGEVVLRALGAANAAYVHLKPNGDVLIKGANVTVDMTGEFKSGLAAAQLVSLANLVDLELTAISAVITTLCGALGIAPIPYTFPGTAPLGIPPNRSTGATKTKAL